ncbi:hypothetical protein BDV25DRAFT_148731 [Aspergillus avenaceus]|uniref:Uncharacterized protein n=1 Tax=Aspergillus avenaceus TaxID=36643 RepID=A0A5N6U539_ASPAV|nr:hypothetical protein BDV25DRAFT_148731 [Aspergillus avenaceus]
MNCWIVCPSMTLPPLRLGESSRLPECTGLCHVLIPDSLLQGYCIPRNRILVRTGDRLFCWWGVVVCSIDLVW